MSYNLIEKWMCEKLDFNFLFFVNTTIYVPQYRRYRLQIDPDWFPDPTSVRPYLMKLYFIYFISKLNRSSNLFIYVILIPMGFANPKVIAKQRKMKQRKTVHERNIFWSWNKTRLHYTTCVRLSRLYITCNWSFRNIYNQ